ncbi:MAG: hypothetical protein HYZ47_02635 [Simkania negevensis]|nr:hypothetical protein [Simkania negevensis]
MAIQMCGNALKLVTVGYFITKNFGEFSNLAKTCCTIAQKAINNFSEYLQGPKEKSQGSQALAEKHVSLKKGLDVADYLIEVGGFLFIFSRAEKSDHSFLSVIIISHLLHKQVIKDIFDNPKQEETRIPPKGASSSSGSNRGGRSTVNNSKQRKLKRRYSEISMDRYIGEISLEIRNSQEKLVDKINKLALSLGRFYVVHFLSGLISPSLVLTVNCFISDQRGLNQIKSLIPVLLKKFPNKS